MRPIVLSCLALLAAAGARAQDRPKIDSLLLRLAMPREEAAGAVVAAFTKVGLGVTNTTPFLVEADQGGNQDVFSGTTYRRVVRAVLMSADSASTAVLITGTEIRDWRTQYGPGHKQLRIDNRAGGNGGKVWRMMLAAASMLDTAAVRAVVESERWPP